VVRALDDVPGEARVRWTPKDLVVDPRSRRLNPEQLAAIGATGNVLVSAGAGTGKTLVLVERFADAVCDRGLDVESILVITYTEKAAGELRSRIRARLTERGRPDYARRLDGAWISTIHGFCHRLLRAYPFAAGVDPRFRVLDDSQARVLAGEAFEEALTAFCATERPERLRLLATYGARPLRRMLTGVYETLRSAGRPLELRVGEGPRLPDRLEQWREAARCTLDDTTGMPAAERQREQVAGALELLEAEPPVDRLLDLSGYQTRGGPRERFALYEEARRAVEQAALDEASVRDRELLQELLATFAERYEAAKDRESALDFEDLQLRARELLRGHEEIRERERWRFRAVMVDEFQDTNRLQCELIDLITGVSTPPSGAAGGGGPEGIVLGTDPKGTAPSAASGSGDVKGTAPSAASGSGDVTRAEPVAGAAAGDEGVGEVFFVGDEFQSIYGFRHADVQVFRERRAEAKRVLPLTLNYRSRPEVLAAVNYLFRADFGDQFQPLAASGEFPDPVFGTPVELLVTDKSSYADSGTHWRRAEARHVAARVKELVESGAAKPGEIVLLFAAGTDAEWYEEELRALGLPTYRSTGRGYFGQQQVGDLLAYLRLLHNRYDDQALVSVLASPFVGVSNDALVLLRRAAPKRPLFTGLERSLPEGLSPRDERLFKAFRQRFDRLAAATSLLSLERLCEEIVTAHDYDLAVLAQWDGRRRYANLRKLARLARSYEELRGADIEGFVRFVRDQDEAGAKELEAVAEEEDADVVRLLTIHAAKGLEFKVVVVADAGRERMTPSADEILALPDGRVGFRVADPITGRRVGSTEYESVKEANRVEAEAERRRLYYVAMTRAVDRLIVAGSVDPERASDRTPIEWVLKRLDVELADEVAEIEREGARIVVRLDRYRPEAFPEEPQAVPADTQLELFTQEGGELAPLVPGLPELAPIAEPPLHRVRTLSYSALSLFARCSYRYYAERVVGMRPADGAGSVLGQEGLAATEIGDAVHRLLEQVDLREPAPPDPAQVRSWYPAATEPELERIRALVSAYCDSGLARRIAELDGAAVERPFAFEHDGVLLHGRLDVLHRADGRALVVDYKTNVLEEAEPDEVVEHDYRLQRLVYALACLRDGADEVEVVYQFLERPDDVITATFQSSDMPALEAELSAAIAEIQTGVFRPTPSESACAGCPALDLVCAGPRLRNGGGAVTVAEPVAGAA
jgi:ATP-dependent exoDNAse (exonuclease V) beta subunit